MIRKMLSAILCAGFCAGVAGAAAVVPKEKSTVVDYCKLNLDSFPSYREVAELALEADPLFPESLPEMREKIRKSALAPRLRVEAKLGSSYYPEYGYENLSGTFTNGTGTQNYDYNNQIWANQGYNQDELAQTYQVSLEWKLNNLMYHSDEEYAVYNYRAAQDYRLWQFNELANLYLELVEALETKGSGEPDRELRNTIQAAGAELDIMLGYHIRDVLIPRAEKTQAAPREPATQASQNREGSSLRKVLDEEKDANYKKRVIMEEEELQLQNSNEDEN